MKHCLLLLCFITSLLFSANFCALNAQIVRDGIKIKVFTKFHKSSTSKPKSIELKESELLDESGIICCSPDEFDRIELSGNETVTVKVHEGFDEELGDVVFLIKDFPLYRTKATFKPLEGRDDMGWYTVFILKGDKILLQFKYRFMSCT